MRERERERKWQLDGLAKSTILDGVISIVAFSPTPWGFAH